MNLVHLCLQFPPNYHHLGALPRGAGPEWSVQVGDCAEFGLAPGQVEDVYFNSPLSYLPNIEDPDMLARYRGKTIIICAGLGARKDEAMADTRAMGDILKSKNVDAWIDFRDTDDNHDRPWRYRQMNYF